MFYVSGLHGSGTSLVSRYIHHLGVNMMGDKEMDKYNEDPELQTIARQVVLENGIVKKGNLKTTLQDSAIDSRFLPVRVKGDTFVISSENLESFRAALSERQEPWGVKMPTLAILIWLFIPYIEEWYTPTIVHVFREPAINIRSFGFRRMSGNPRDEKAFCKHLEKVWVKYNLSVLDFYEAYKNKYTFHFVSGKGLKNNPKLFAKRLGLEYKPLDAVCDPNLFTDEKIKYDLFESTEQLYSHLLNLEKEQETLWLEWINAYSVT